ncbi:MAG: PTS fructose transporter subunit IIA [Alphaproteobacteria bacterium]|nr:PTS fructose transporter subunit IIA [Alphaproteobacteria bacterium]MCZ6496720.1 PTS fructose transporter subunit IIA [Alphaproteobacteria bacterium]MCZ6609600.1 PTS fructose transporter subunit IIA [Alphaproteobacteria bacterium]MCZ6847731.1 PTS fructose transporter subunit IIA [Alphaproteobacteria bacterium]
MTRGGGSKSEDKTDHGVVGLVLVTHGAVGVALLEALENIVGGQDNVVSVSIQPDDDVEARRAEILDAIARVGAGGGCILMTDMFGGTPSNLALSAMGEEAVDVIAGVNLPMLIKFASVRASAPLADVVAQVQDAGRKYINVASSFLNPPEPD